MSQKINAKNLQYSSNLPPFLARLRGQNAADSNSPDPVLAARRRPVKPRSGSAEAEDAPLVIDEYGNAVDVTVGVDGSVKEKEAASAGAEEKQSEDPGPAGTTDAAASGEKLAGIGDQRKKRKIGKVIGASADEEDTKGRNSEDQKVGKAKTADTATAKEKDDSGAAAKTKTKKKAKKIKLSFGDDEG